MPLHLGSANHCRELFCVEADGLLVISPTNLPRDEPARMSACETLQRRDDIAAMIVLQERNLLTQVFAEAWNTLPSRLASFAVCPPAATFVVVRADRSARLLRNTQDTIDALWRCLLELAKEEPRIEVRTDLCPDELVLMDKVRSADDADETWLPELLSTPPRRELEWLFGELHLARLSDLCGDIVSPADATAVLAGLWLLHGDADASHRQSQSIEDEGRHRCGNFWHAIMHRQEPDYGNSKYWFRRVGQHPIFPELARRADDLIVANNSETARRWRTKLGTPNGWNASAFVDWCEAATREADARQIHLIRRIQFVEMHLLLRASLADATSST